MAAPRKQCPESRFLGFLTALFYSSTGDEKGAVVCFGSAQNIADFDPLIERPRV